MSMDATQQKTITAVVGHIERSAAVLQVRVLDNLDSLVGDGKEPVDLGQLDRMVKKAVMQVVTQLKQDRLDLLHMMRLQGGENGSAS
ncbi:MAG: hypothetical protein A2W31_06805 [Planctomycetes bacterium RBG_16_64_10]|nr:MAG: hypothetical protein A2W31_06805 [Planctomycetes bacterium RBG_16_64_10]